MDAPYAERTSLTCPQCGHEFPAEVWIIVDGAARPDLLARAKGGTLHQVTCRNAGARENWMRRCSCLSPTRSPAQWESK